MIIDAFKYILINNSIYIKVEESLIEKIKFLINKNYKSLKSFNLLKLKINYGTLKYEFRKAEYHPFQRMSKIAKLINLSKEEIFKNIKGFRAVGSHRKEEIILPRRIEIDENFIEGYALYLAEGDTGFNGITCPKKLRFTNSNLRVIKLFIHWLKAYFPGVDFYLSVILPPGMRTQESFSHDIGTMFNLDVNPIRVSNDFYNKLVKYRVCCDNMILIYLVLSLEETIKKLCLGNKNLAAAYIRGMMIGEGTAYFNRSRYVRIEMRNEKEIKYLHKLFLMLGFACKPSLRSERENMWSIYIGAKQLERFYDHIGFGAHQERQNILERAVNKKIRINQYV